MSRYYIIPSTTSYYDEIEADSKDSALELFASSMDMNMSAYFMATEKRPESGVHDYKKPKNTFERKMNNIANAMRYNTGEYDFLFPCMNKIIMLQDIYDSMRRSMNKKTRKHFSKILKGLIKKTYVKQERCRVFIEDVDAARKILNERKISWEIDANVYFLIKPDDMREAINAMEQAGINAYDI